MVDAIQNSNQGWVGSFRTHPVNAEISDGTV